MSKFDGLHCPLCTKVYVEPRALKCLHTLCMACIRGSCKVPKLKCPLCKYVTFYPTFEQIPKNVVVQDRVRRTQGRKSCANCGVYEASWNCRQCCALLCDQCSTKIHQNEVFKFHECTKIQRVALAIAGPGQQPQKQQLQQPPPSPTTRALMARLPASAPLQLTPLCTRHVTEALTFFCAACKLPMCKDCVSDGSHRGHGLAHRISDFVHDCEKRVSGMMAPLSEQQRTLRSVQALVQDATQRVSTQSAECEKQISDEFDKIRRVLDDRQAHLLATVHDVRDAKLSLLAQQLATLQLVDANIGHSIAVAYSLLPFSKRRELRDAELFLSDSNTLVDSPSRASVIDAGTSDEIVFSEVDVAAIAGDIDEYTQFCATQRVDTTPCVDPKIHVIIGDETKDQINHLLGSLGNIAAQKVAERVFPFTQFGASDGVLHYLGCSRGIQLYANPASIGLAAVQCSTIGYGRPENIVSSSRSQFCTQNVPLSWISIELASPLVLSHYGFYHDEYDAESHFMRNWEVHGFDAELGEWSLLSMHRNDTTVNVQHPFGAWEINSSSSRRSSPSSVEAPAMMTPFRKFRILMTGPNSNGNHYLMLSGLELYGTLLDG